MEIVLTKYVDDLGAIGDVVRVKAGYARNYLFPQKMAVRATEANLKLATAIAKREEDKENKIRKELEQFAAKLAQVSITSAVTVGEDEKVFGSVTAQNISDQLKEQGFEIARKDILLEEPLKALGQYDVKVKLGYGVTGAVTVWVVQE